MVVKHPVPHAVTIIVLNSIITEKKCEEVL